MPRPGPRPYECVRRAWHSDRNQPMRGSIIQQILRVVHETHSPRTKKNKEWQEKLPIVVFRAEEIMYSKANSEAEYMNLDTLWDRVNDAINTIIRRDESTETGELLPPCVEAALNLGCIPVRASRSQRHSTPRTYLTPRPPESSSLQPRSVDKCIDEQSPGLSPLHSTSQLSFVRSTTNVGSAPPVPESTCRVTGNNNLPPRDYPFLAENIPSRGNKMMKMESNIPQKPTSVYPLYYGTQYQREDPKIKKDMNSGTTFVGKPVGTSILDSSTETCVFQNLFSFPGSDTAFKRTSSPEFGQPHKRQNAAECDLSLRLGLSTDLCTSTDRGSASETEDIGSSSQELEFSGLSSQKNKSKEFCFFPEKSSIDPYGSFSKSKWFSEGECHDNRKPQAPFGDNLENLQFCYRPGFSPNWPAGPKSGPGL